MYISYLKAVLGRRAAIAFGTAIVLGLLGAGLEVATAYCFKFLVLVLKDQGDSRESLGLFCFLLAGLGTARSTVVFFLSQTCNMGAELVAMRSRLLLSYHVLNGKSLEILAPSKIHHLFNGAMTGSTLFVRNLTDFIVQSTLVVVLTGALFRLAWREALLAFVLTFLVGGIYLLTLKSLKGRTKNLSDLQQTTQRDFGRINRNWISIRVLQQQQQEHARLFQSMLAYSNGLLRIAALNTLNASGPSIIGTAMLSIILYATVQYFHGDAAVILPFIFLLVRALGNCSMAYSSLGYIALHRPYFEEMGRFILSLSPAERAEATRKISQIKYFGKFGLSAQPESLPRKAVPSSHDAPPAIRFTNAGFTHLGARDPLFTEVSFALEPGGHLGIVGPSGVGKSTLLLLLLGVTDPTEGKIEINGMAPADYLKKNPGQVGYLGADSVLDDYTLRENLLFGIADAMSDEALIAALQMVKLEHLVSRSNEGLNLRISDMTVRLSSGEKQRLAFAHILLQAPQLLVLDEPTANLDSLSETLIIGLIKNMAKKCTVVTVSHRPIFDPRQQILDLSQNRRWHSRGA